MLHLRTPTSPAWLQAVLADFDAFLLDHAACERKAAASAMSFVVRYPDRTALLDPVIALAREELEHFHQVYRWIAARGLRLAADTKDEYAGALLGHVRTGRDDRLLDRLIVFAVMEGRGCERFGLVAEGLEDPELASFYTDLTMAEAQHHGLFLRLAREYFSPAAIQSRLDELLDVEAEVVANLPLRPALH
jgi:tRNA-(ms[2]io[6]A)-hydroxylase